MEKNADYTEIFLDKIQKYNEKMEMKAYLCKMSNEKKY